MTSFPLPVKATINDELSMPVRMVQFGDGYKERAPNGLNRPREIWSVEVAYASDVAGANLQAFLVEHGQHKPFQWQSPRDSSPQNYCILGGVSGSFRRGGGDKPKFFTRSMKFERVWDAIVTTAPVAILPSVSVVASGMTGWIISRTGATIGNLSVNYSLAVIPGTTVNGVATIPIGNSSIFVSISGATGNRTELLSLGVGTGYSVGSPGSASITIMAVVILPSVSVVASGVTGWIISRTGATIGNLSVNYSLAVTPGTTVNGVATIPIGDSSVMVNVTTLTITRTELLTITSGTNYDIGTPDNATISIIGAAIGNILSLRFEGASIIDDTGKIVINEAVTLSTLAPFSGLGSGYFEDTSRLTVHLNNEIGLGDFTIKCAVKFSQPPVNEYIFDFGYNTYRLAWYNGSWNMYDTSVGFFLDYPHVPVVDTWYEIAICRSGLGGARTHRMYFNGTLVASQAAGNFNLITGSYPIGAGLFIGNSGIIVSGSLVALNGYLDNFSISDFAEFV
jgi:phage-related protein